MDDKDNLYFSFDDEGKEEPEPEKEVKAEEGQNRSFVVVAIVLAAVFVLGICGVVGYIFFGSQIQGLLGGTQAAQGPSSNELTNQFMQTAIAMTATASFGTQSAPTAAPTKTQAPKPSTTPTSSISEVTQVGTQVAEVTETTGTPGTPGATATKGLAGAPTTAAPGTGTPGKTGTPGTGTPGGVAAGTTTTPTVKPTSSIVEVTPLGGANTPTQIVSGVGGTPTSSIVEVTASGGGAGGGGTAVPTGVGGPFTPAATSTMPATGFGGGAGLAGAGLLAMLLVVVVVVVRKIRLNQ